MRWGGAVVLLLISIKIFFEVVLMIPSTPQLISFTESLPSTPSECYRRKTPPEYIDNNGILNLLVWNIYKQKNKTWKSELTRLSSESQLVLLQETRFNSAFKSWVKEFQWKGVQATAFRVLDDSMGVATIGKIMPNMACAQTTLEPWLRLPKSGISAQYALSDGRQLIVINIHSVNFAYGIEEYFQQLDSLIQTINEHDGPVIVAGDFNTWNERRMAKLNRMLTPFNMKEVTFYPDHRLQFITGLALDSVFYRGMTVLKAESIQTDASDHNPMKVQFKL